MEGCLNKINIKVIVLGDYPVSINFNKIKKFNSSLFSIAGEIDSISMRINADLPDWAYSDESLEKMVPERNGEDILLAITNVPLDLNWYTRRLNGCRVVLTLYEIRDICLSKNLPVENAILRVLHAYSLVYLSSDRTIPTYGSIQSFTHDETRGCLFDMNGDKLDIVHSCDKPIICPECRERLTARKVSKRLLDSAEKDIKKITKDSFYKISDFVRSHPIISISVVILSSFLTSVLAALFYDLVLKF